MTNPGSNGEVPRKRRSYWTKAALITGCGMMVVGFPVVMFLNSTGVIPAASTLEFEERNLIDSGAMVSPRDVERAYGVPENQNAATILSYLTGPEGRNTSIEFPLDPERKPRARYSVSWERFLADIDRVSERPHFRPSRDFRDPYRISLTELEHFRNSFAELARQAMADLEERDFEGAEAHVRRLCTLDKWSTDQPFYSSKFLRISSLIPWRELIGRVAVSPPGRPEPKRILESFKTSLARKIEMDSLAEFQAYSLSRAADVLFESSDFSRYLLSGGIALPTTAYISPLEEFETKAFACALISPLGGRALRARSYAVANKFYREWKRTRNLEIAYGEAHKVAQAGGKNRLVEFVSNVMPTTGYGELPVWIKSGPKIGLQFVEIALWIHERRKDPTFNLSKLKVSDLPASLRTDDLGKPISIARSGDTLLIYSFGFDAKDDRAGKRDLVLPIPLNPR